MPDKTLRYEVRGGVAHLTLDRPEAANGVDLRLAQDLLDATLALGDDPSVRAVLLTGAGARFCGGGDLKTFAEDLDNLGPYLRRTLTVLHAAIERLVHGDAPVVAGVHGSVAGAGIGLMSAADIVVVGESTKFVMAYTGVGLTPDGASSWFLPRLVGLRRALDLTLTNRVLDAGEALEWGLVSRVVPDDAVAKEATALADQLARGPARALSGAKHLMRLGSESGLEAQLAAEAEQMARIGRTRDAREGVRAFVDRRPPEFTGE